MHGQPRVVHEASQGRQHRSAADESAGQRGETSQRKRKVNKKDSFVLFFFFLRTRHWD